MTWETPAPTLCGRQVLEARVVRGCAGSLGDPQSSQRCPRTLLRTLRPGRRGYSAELCVVTTIAKWRRLSILCRVGEASCPWESFVHGGRGAPGATLRLVFPGQPWQGAEGEAHSGLCPNPWQGTAQRKGDALAGGMERASQTGSHFLLCCPRNTGWQ